MADGTVQQNIKICYKFIGFVDELHITPTKRWTALPAKYCMVCGVEYVPGSAISKYCPECREKIRKTQGTETKRRSRERNKNVCIELSAKNDRLAKIWRGSGVVYTHQRMDFLMLLSNGVRIVIEIDGKQHYSEGDKSSPKLYSEMVIDTRELQLKGYEVYRFGGYEFMNITESKRMIGDFFEKLFKKIFYLERMVFSDKDCIQR